MKYSLSFLLVCCLGFFFAPEMNAQTAAVSADSEISTLTVKVTGVGCSSDLKSIGANIEKLSGVNTCEVVKRGAVTHFAVSYDPTQVSAEAIHQAIQDTPGCKNPDSRPYRVKV